jgi:hypothetical protein
MPEGYGLPKDGSGADILSWEIIEQWLRDARNYWIGTTNPNGTPHVIPVWGLWLDGAAVFSTGRDSRKGRNLAASPSVAIHLESGDNVTILYGEVQELTDPVLLERYVEDYDAKYSIRPDPYEAGSVVYALYPKKALTWLEHDFPNTATRWRFDS